MAIYSGIYKGPPKSYGTTSAKKRYIAIHNTSNNATAESESSYAKNRTDSVSSHYYVDNNSIVQSLDTKNRAFHAGSQVGNTYAIAYEITGTNSKSRDWWMKNVAWDLLAKQIATDMKLWGIQNKHLSISEMQRGGISGIVTHDDMRRAWGGTTHNDPGGNFPMDYLISKINQYLSGGSGGGNEDDMAGEIADAALKQLDGRNALGEVYLRILEGKSETDKTYNSPVSLTNINSKLDVLLAKQSEDVNEEAIVTGILATLTPAAIAAAIPAELAKDVADELSTRLTN